MSDSEKDLPKLRDPLLDADLSAPFFELPDTEFSLDGNRREFKSLIVLFAFVAPSFIIFALVFFFAFALNSPQRISATLLFCISVLTVIGFAFLAKHLLTTLFKNFETSKNYLKKSEEQFRLLANSIPDLVSVARGNGIGLWYNDAWYRYTGSSPQDSNGINWKHIHHPDYFQKVFAAWEKAVSTGLSFEMQFPLKGADGHFRRFLYRATPIKNSMGEIFLWFGTATDIENEMIRRDDFLSIASHEIKTPLTSLNLQVQLLEKYIQTNGQNLPQHFRESIASCRLQMDRIIHLINSVLDLTQIQLGTLTLNKKNMDLSHLAREVCTRFRVEATNKGVSIAFFSNKSVMGCWDPVRVDQILTNLISNALKYGDQKPISVTINHEEKDALAYLTVEDQGSGIPPELEKQLFNRFNRAHSVSKKQGLGLGLFVSQQLAAVHGGRLSFEPRPEPPGTKFILTLPIS